MYKLINTKNGRLIVNTNDSIITKELCNKGVWEKYMLDFAKETIKKDSCVIDAGANMGTMCIPFSFMAPSVEVHAFEPSRVLFNQLCGNLFLNDCLNVYPHNLALSNKDEILTFDEVNLNNMANYGDTRMFGGQQKVKAVALDSLQFSKKISFIKVDCQGFDLQVLLGAKQKIIQDSPVIVVEWEKEMAKNLNHNFNDLVAYMNSLGYNKIYNLYHNDWVFTKI